MRAALKRWLKSRRRTTPLYTDTELGCIVDAGIARALIIEHYDWKDDRTIQEKEA